MGRLNFRRFLSEFFSHTFELSLCLCFSRGLQVRRGFGVCTAQHGPLLGPTAAARVARLRPPPRSKLQPQQQGARGRGRAVGAELVCARGRLFGGGGGRRRDKNGAGVDTCSGERGSKGKCEGTHSDGETPYVKSPHVNSQTCDPPPPFSPAMPPLCMTPGFSGSVARMASSPPAQPRPQQHL
jgi:hypothetical protein